MTARQTTAENTPIHGATDLTPRQLARHAYNNGIARQALAEAKDAATNLIHAAPVQTQVEPETYARLLAAARQLRSLIEQADQQVTESYHRILEGLNAPEEETRA